MGTIGIIGGYIGSKGYILGLEGSWVVVTRDFLRGV